MQQKPKKPKRLERRIRPTEFAALLGVSLRTLYNEMAAGRIEPPLRMTPRTSSWSGEYVQSVIETRKTAANSLP